MAQDIRFCLRLFTGSSAPEIESGERKLRALLGALIVCDLEWLRLHPTTPGLYNSGVRYRREPPPKENWRDIPTVLAAGCGDCEDLACWRVAEIRARQGIKVRAVPIGRKGPADQLLYHIVVRWPDSHLEDPSRRLGMGGPGDEGSWEVTG